MVVDVTGARAAGVGVRSRRALADRRVRDRPRHRRHPLQQRVGQRPHVQHRVLAARPEVPRVVVARHPVHVHVPVGVDARRVAGQRLLRFRRRLQFAGRLALRRGVVRIVGDAGHVRVPVGVGDRAVLVAHRAADVLRRRRPRGSHRALGPGDGYGGAGRVVAHQPADVHGVAGGGGHVAGGVDGPDGPGVVAAHQPARVYLAARVRAAGDAHVPRGVAGLDGA